MTFKRTIRTATKFAIVLILAVTQFASASSAESNVYVTVREAKLRAKADFLSTASGGVKYGDKLGVVKDSDSWLLVTSGGKQGYIHRSAISERKIVLNSSAGYAANQADQNDVVLAGKGFSAEVEKQFAKNHTSANFADVDAMERIKVSPAELSSFVQQGKLGNSGS